MTRFAYLGERRVVAWNQMCFVRPDRSAVVVDDGHLFASFGPWKVATTVDNVLSVARTGPYRLWRVAGPARLALSDRGLTFATNTSAGLCMTFAEPVAGIEPVGLIRHSTLTVTVADVEGLAIALGFEPPLAHEDLAHGTFIGTARAVWRSFRRDNTVTHREEVESDVSTPPGDELPSDSQPAESGIGP